MCVFFGRFIGSTRIPLRELSSGQLRSLPAKNVHLLDENSHNIGVSTFCDFFYLFFVRHLLHIKKYMMISLQATMNLVIGYDPPPNANPNADESHDGDSTVDSGMFNSRTSFYDNTKLCHMSHHFRQRRAR